MNAAVAAVQFALSADEGMEFLRCWNQGDFDVCRREWPEAPETVYVGADPLHPLTKSQATSLRRPETLDLAGRIASAVLADEEDGGCDISAGMFGPKLSALVCELAEKVA